MRLLIGVVVLFGVVACGAPPPTVAPPIGTERVPPRQVVTPEVWKSFPVDRHPRPVVLTSPLPELAGFTTDAAKVAALAGNYELSAALPPAPPTVTAQLSDGPAEFRTLPAEAALAGLRGTGTGTAPNPTDALPILRVELGTAEFGTDRGRIALPAWLFHPADSLGPIAWPALPEDAFWKHDQPPTPGLGPARLGADGTLTVVGPAPSPPCPGQEPLVYKPTVVESATTVSVSVGSDMPDTGTCARDLMLRTAEYQIRLNTPLGNRVLIDEQGSPVPVDG